MAANNIYIQVDFNSQQAQQNVNALNQAIGQTGPVAQKSSQQATAAMSSVQLSVQQTTKAFGELTTALAGLGIARMVSSFIQVGAEVGRAQLMMQAFTGSAAEANKVFEQIRTVAQQSPFRFKDLEEAGSRLLAFGMAAKEVPASLQAITDQVAATGGSIENVNSIVRLFGRVMDKDFVGAMDLFRLLPAQGVKAMDALRDAISKQLGQPVDKTDVTKYLKEGVLDPLETIRLISNTMRQQTGGMGKFIDDAAKAFKNLADEIIHAEEVLAGPQGFGPALSKLAEHIRDLMAPAAALLDWLMKLPEPTKELIVNVAAATAGVVAFAGAWSLFNSVAGPAITAIMGIGKALLFALANPEVLGVVGALTAAVLLFAEEFPEEAKKLEDTATKWVGDLWKKMQDTIGKLAKESGLFTQAKADIPPLQQTGKTVVENSKDSLDAVNKQLQQWADAANRTLLQALSSPAEAILVKYKDLFDELDALMDKRAITGTERDKARAQLTAAENVELEGKLFEKQKQDNAELAKLDEERVKGSYELQIAYIEALDAQDLRGKVAAIDKITAYRVESAKEVAKVQDDEIDKNLANEKALFEAHRKEWSALIDMDKAEQDRAAEAAAKKLVIDQKAIDDEQKYRLEGWKKTNDAIIEDQKRVFEGFKGIFDQIFDALTGKTKDIGKAMSDVFRKLALDEVKNAFSSGLASAATAGAGYGWPDQQIRGTGLLGQLLRRGMPPRPPGPPPDIYRPTSTGESINYPQAAAGSANRLLEGADIYDQATIRFARAVGQFETATVQTRGSADRMVESSGSMTESADDFGDAVDQIPPAPPAGSYDVYAPLRGRAEPIVMPMPVQQVSQAAQDFVRTIGGGGDAAGGFGFTSRGAMPPGLPGGFPLGGIGNALLRSIATPTRTPTLPSPPAGEPQLDQGLWNAPTGLGVSPGAASMARAAAGPPISLASMAGGLKDALSKNAPQLALAAGLPIATAGIFGNLRGTPGGLIESTAGMALAGAGIGMQIGAVGGPLGAAIGAGVGLGIGVGEMIAGVESPMMQVQRLGRQLYHINISNSAANQIVNLAQQSYGGNIAVAMRSPEVRKMMGLYAAGTGQGGVYQQGVNDPHGASLVESGGGLYQQATYEYGRAYTQSSPLPVLGGVQSQVIGPPGAGIPGAPSTYALSLSIGGQDAAKFMVGQVVTPDVIQTQYASAMTSSTGRVPQALMMSAPGSIAG